MQKLWSEIEENKIKLSKSLKNKNNKNEFYYLCFAY